MPRRSRLRPGVVATLALLALSAGCTGGAGPSPSAGDDARGSTSPIRALDPAVSLTEAGARWYAQPDDEGRPRVDVVAELDPATGALDGTLVADLPAGTEAELRFRFFAGLPELDAEPSVGEVTVDGARTASRREASLLTVGLPADHGARVTVTIPFSFTVPEGADDGLLAGLLGGELTADGVGLLSRREDALNLGHWMPLWIPQGASAEPTLDGYGDLGNFTASDLSMTFTVPEGWQVVDTGIRTDEETTTGRTTVRSEGAGMRDLAVAVLRDSRSQTRDLDGELTGVRLIATAPASQADLLDAVLDEAEQAVRVLSARLGAYPWREYDVVSAPLGATVGGMEWPGGTWIESGVFGGGIPGLGDLDLGQLDLGQLDLGQLDLGQLDLGGLDLQGLDLEALLGALGGSTGDLGLLLDSTRAWTIAHEVAHTWWTVLVGNDSILAPAVDEPLAQYTSCWVMRESRPDGEAVCRAQIDSGYEQMRLVGESDGAAARASDEFDSSLQYGGLVYGKAAAFYLALEERFGAEAVTRALRGLVEQEAFGIVGTDDLRAALVAALGDPAGALWDRWMNQSHGDEDLGG